MSWRGLGALLLLAVVGAAGGYLAAGPPRARHDQRRRSRARAGRVAVDPGRPEEPFAEDIDLPDPRRWASTTSCAHHRGLPPFQWAYDAPKGWKATQEGLDEIRWRPADEPEVGGFSLRVKLSTEHKSKADMVSRSSAAMQAGYEDVESSGRPRTCSRSTTATRPGTCSASTCSAGSASPARTRRASRCRSSAARSTCAGLRGPVRPSRRQRREGARQHRAALRCRAW